MGNPNPSPETRFQPGESGNPNGRQKGTLSLTNLLREALAEIPDDKEKKTNARLLVEKTLEKALKEGDTSMIKYCYDRLEGTPTQNHELGEGSVAGLAALFGIVSKENKEE